MNLPIQINSFYKLNKIDKPIYLAIGVFDGLHLGHMAVISSVVFLAKSNQGISAVLTFQEHPSKLFQGESSTKLIMDSKSKVDKFFDNGIDIVITKKFDRKFSSIKAENFLHYLVEKIPTLRVIYVGKNFRFGRGRLGDVKLLEMKAKELGIRVISKNRIKKNGIIISSTKIRELLRLGEIKKVNSMLGYFYKSYGVVVKGKKLGRRIGFPTLNLLWNPECKPCFGVYLVRLILKNKIILINGIANYGLRPTFHTLNTSNPILEIHLLINNECFLKEGDYIEIEWIHFIRKEKKFRNIDYLKRQIKKDVKFARDYFSNDEC